MKPLSANFINGLILIIAGLYGYFGITGSTGVASATALIPTAFGLLLITLGLFWKKSPKAILYTVAILTIVLLIMVINRFVKIDEWDIKKIIFLACIISNAVALFVFVKSFLTQKIKL
jgi:LytS/YehU family sensor histidine kinase